MNFVICFIPRVPLGIMRANPKNGNSVLQNHPLNERKVGLNVINRYDDFITQLPFELKLTMPPTDRGGRGYSDELVAKVIKELLT